MLCWLPTLVLVEACSRPLRHAESTNRKREPNELYTTPGACHDRDQFFADHDRAALLSGGL